MLSGYWLAFVRGGDPNGDVRPQFSLEFFRHALGPAMEPFSPPVVRYDRRQRQSTGLWFMPIRRKKGNPREALRRGKLVKGRLPRVDAGGQGRLSWAQQLSRVSERLEVAEKELARLSAENARLVTENSLLRAKLQPRSRSNA
jgi:hypothetical protein